MNDNHLHYREQDSQEKHPNRKGAHSLKSRWISYVAGGVAAVASGQHADGAKIMNMGNLDMTGGPVTLAKNGELALDLDNNGVPDVTLFNAASSSFSGSGEWGGNAGARGSLLGMYGQWGGSAQYNYAMNFSRVSSIGPNFTRSFVAPAPGVSPTNPGGGVWNYSIHDNGYQWYLRNGNPGFWLSGWGSYQGTSIGYDNNVAGFLGIRFNIGSDTHFGFVEMEIDVSVLNDAWGTPANVATILSYGYESDADSHISGPGDGNFVRNDTLQMNWFESADSVDEADFLQWRQGFGTPNPTQRDGDADRNGSVDAADYTAWRDSLGQVRRSPPPGLGSASNARVPEPNSLGLMALGAAGLMALRRVRRARREQQEKTT